MQAKDFAAWDLGANPIQCANTHPAGTGTIEIVVGSRLHEKRNWMHFDLVSASPIWTRLLLGTDCIDAAGARALVEMVLDQTRACDSEQAARFAFEHPG